MEKKIQHLQMIQGIINRMASNSFMLKGWAVTLIAGIFALASKDSDRSYFIIAYIPVLVFWGLDSYYLHQERLYRALYNKMRQTDEESIDFSLTATVEEFGDNNNTICSCIKSKTESYFYLSLVLACTIVLFICK